MTSTLEIRRILEHYFLFLLSHKPKRLQEETTLPSRKVVLVGDWGVGKASLVAAAFYGGMTEFCFPPDYSSTPISIPLNFDFQQRLYHNKVPTGGLCREESKDKEEGMLKIQLDVCRDTSSEDYARLRALNYPNSQAIAMCFAIDYEESLTNIVDKVRITIELHIYDN